MLCPLRRSAGRFFLLQCSIAGLLVALPARAEIESDQVKLGLAAFDGLDFPRCVTELEKALHESLTKEEKVATLKTLAFCQQAVAHDDDARLTFQKLLAVDPTFEIDRTISPRVRKVFEEAKQK